MFALLPFAVLLQLFSRVAASPVDAPHPMITQRAELFPRQDLNSFIGYFTTTDLSGNTVVASSFRPSSVLTIRGTLADWCWDDPSYLASTCSSMYWTTCSGNTLYSAAGSASCPVYCDYDIIYTGSTKDSNSLQWYRCQKSTGYNVFFREQPTGTLIEDITTTDSTETPSFTIFSDLSTDSPSPSSPSTPSGTPSAPSAPSSTTTPITPTPEDPPQQKEPSKAWIAGVVIGIVGLLAFAAIAFYLIRQRKKSNQTVYQPAPQGPQMQMQPPGYPPQHTGYPMQQQPYGAPLSPGQQAVSPNISAYDAQGYYTQPPKPLDGGVYPQYGAPPLDVGTAQMPMQAHTQGQAPMGASVQELPELAPPSNR